MYAGIRKFLQFQLTVNLVALIFSVTCSVAVKASPLTAVQMLWVNLIMDSFAALALATEPPSEELLLGQPHRRGEYIITRDMAINIIIQTVFQLAVLFVFLFLAPMLLHIQPGWESDEYSETNTRHYTLLFHTFVML